jgi:hypothetical protein
MKRKRLNVLFIIHLLPPLTINKTHPPWQFNTLPAKANTTKKEEKEKKKTRIGVQRCTAQETLTESGCEKKRNPPFTARSAYLTENTDTRISSRNPSNPFIIHLPNPHFKDNNNSSPPSHPETHVPFPA